jgi:hypothetical protein
VLTGLRDQRDLARQPHELLGSASDYFGAAATDGAFPITLEIERRLIRSYAGPAYPSTLTGSLEWQGAKRIPASVGASSAGNGAFPARARAHQAVCG